jgi:alpha-galactosidase
MIETGRSGRLWLLSGPGSGYALHLTDRDELLHLHWGARITLADAEALAGDPLPPARPFEAALDGHEEYPVEGGPGSVRPALCVRSATVRGTEWCFEEAETVDGGAGEPRMPAGGGGEELRLHFHDSLHHLDLTLHYRLRSGCDVIERWITATHGRDGRTGALELPRADTATWTLPYRDGWRLSQVHGRWAAENRLVRGPLTPGERMIGSRGHPGQGHLPWVALDAAGPDGGDAAGEEHGEVWTAALAWSGSWRIVVAALPGGRVQITGGAGHDDSGPLRLEPGESWTSPVFAGLWTAHGFGAASRAWHAYQRDHVLPRTEGARQEGAQQEPAHPQQGRIEQAHPVLYHSFDAAGFDIDEGRQRELARRAAAMGVEVFVVDDGWCGARAGDRAGPGDRTARLDSFPRGLKALADDVHAYGMGFGIRVEPEMTGPDSDLCRAHPEWVRQSAGGGTGSGRPLMLDLGRADVREYLWERLDALLHSAPVDFVRWDVNSGRTEPGRPGERFAQRLPARHVQGIYALLDRLRAAHPRVTVESCAGGGRVDLGILARADRVSASDNTDPLDRLRIQHGFSQLHPARVMATWVTDAPGGRLNHRAASLRFRFVSAMAGVLGIGGDLLEWSADERAEAASWVALHKTVRPVVRSGDLYRLRPPGDGGLSAVQYVHGADTVVLAWLHAQSFGEPVPPLRLRGLDRAASYRDVTTGVVQRGAVLAERGLRTTLAGDLDAAVFHLRRV